MSAACVGEVRLATSTISPDSTVFNTVIISRIKRYEGCAGRIAALFGKAYAVQLDTSSSFGTIYLNKKSLVKKIFATPNKKINPSLFENAEIIHRLVLENLNPVVGKPILYRQVEDLFERIRTPEIVQMLDSSDCNKTAYDAVVNRLRTIRQPGLEKLEFEQKLLEEKLLPGDIFCRKIKDGVRNGVVVGQTFEKLFMGKPREREAYKFSHLAIYLGNGRIAEAAWPTGRGDEIRNLPLHDSRFAVSSQSGFHYVVCRFHDRALAEQAAEVADRIADKVPCVDCPGSQETRMHYSIPLALNCILGSASFGRRAKEQYLEQYLDDKKKQMPRIFKNPTGLFCSYLVMLAYQTAESRTVCPNILGPCDSLDDEAIRTRSCFEAIKREIWAKMESCKHHRQLDKQVKLKFDSRRISPQYFRNFKLTHPELFQDKFIVGEHA